MGIHPEWYFISPFEMLKLLGMVKWLQGEPGEIAGILAVHHRHCAVGHDSVLRHHQRLR